MTSEHRVSPAGSTCTPGTTSSRPGAPRSWLPSRGGPWPRRTRPVGSPCRCTARRGTCTNRDALARVDGTPRHVGELPVFRRLAGDRTLVAAPHGDHAIGPFDEVGGQRLRPGAGGVDATRGEDLDHGRMDPPGGGRPGRASLVQSGHRRGEEVLGDLAASGVLRAHEEDVHTGPWYVSL